MLLYVVLFVFLFSVVKRKKVKTFYRFKYGYLLKKKEEKKTKKINSSKEINTYSERESDVLSL